VLGSCSTTKAATFTNGQGATSAPMLAEVKDAAVRTFAQPRASHLCIVPVGCVCLVQA
jgi:hypothetical protein